MTLHLRKEESLFERPLRRSGRRRMICGVCGGVAEWLGWDVTLVRVLFVLFTILSSPLIGIVAYGVLAVLIPDPPDRVLLREYRYWDEFDRL